MLSDSDIRERIGPVDSAQDPKQRPRIKRRVGSVVPLFVLCVLLWVGGGAFFFHLARTCPHTRQPAAGRIYRMSTGGQTWYLTAQERDRAVGCAVLPFLGTLALALFRRGRKPPPEEG
jgi:hypothetical protein